MVYIIRKIVVLPKTTRTLKRFLRSLTDFYFLKKNNYFFHNI